MVYKYVCYMFSDFMLICDMTILLGDWSSHFIINVMMFMYLAFTYPDRVHMILIAHYF